MAIDFSLPSDVVELRDKIRSCVEKEVEPVAKELEKIADRRRWAEHIGGGTSRRATGLGLLF